MLPWEQLPEDAYGQWQADEFKRRTDERLRQEREQERQAWEAGLAPSRADGDSALPAPADAEQPSALTPDLWSALKPPGALPAGPPLAAKAWPESGGEPGIAPKAWAWPQAELPAPATSEPESPWVTGWEQARRLSQGGDLGLPTGVPYLPSARKVETPEQAAEELGRMLQKEAEKRRQGPLPGPGGLTGAIYDPTLNLPGRKQKAPWLTRAEEPPGAGGLLFAAVGAAGERPRPSPPVSKVARALGDEQLIAALQARAGEATLPEVDKATLARLPNLAKLDLSEGTRRALLATAQEIPDQIDALRRGVITHAQLVDDLAQSLGMTAADFLKTKPGRAFNETELTVLRATVVAKQAEMAQTAQTVLEKGGVAALNPAEKVRLVEQLLEARDLQAIGRGASATAGRALGAHRITIGQAQAMQMVGRNESIAAERAVKEAAEQTALAQKATEQLVRRAKKNGHLPSDTTLTDLAKPPGPVGPGPEVPAVTLPPPAPLTAEAKAIARAEQRDLTAVGPEAQKMERRRARGAATEDRLTTQQIGAALDEYERQIAAQAAEGLRQAKAAELAAEERSRGLTQGILGAQTTFEREQTTQAERWATAQARATALEARQGLSQAKAAELAEEQKYLDGARQALREAEAKQRLADAQQRRLTLLGAKDWAGRLKTAERLLDQLGGVQVTDELLNRFMQTLEADNPLATARFLRGLDQVRWGQRLGILRYGSMLSATSTHLLNTTGNLVNLGLEVPIRAISIAADLPRAALTGGPRTVYGAEMSAWLRGLTEGAQVGLQDALTVLRTGIDPNELGKIESSSGRVRFNTGFGFEQTLPGKLIGERASAAVDVTMEAPLRLLTAADKFFRGAAFGGEMRAQAVRQAIHEGLEGSARVQRVEQIMGNLDQFPELAQAAYDRAARVVFQENRQEMQTLSRLRYQPYVGTVVSLAVPFMKTPYNIAAQGVGLTPAGFFGAFVAARQGDTALATERAARAVAGTVIMGAALAAAANGNLTGAKPRGKEATTLPLGWQPYSFRFFDPVAGDVRYMSYKELGALGLPLAMAAVLGDLVAEGESVTEDLLAQTAAAAGKYINDQPFLQGLDLISKVTQDPERWAANTVEGLATQFMPYGSLQRQINRALDNPSREPRGVLEALLAISPLTQGQVPARLTRLGEEAHPQQVGPAVFLTPFRTGLERDESILAELRDNGVGLPGPAKSVQGVPLTPDEGREYQALAGGQTRAALETLIRSGAYRTLQPHRRAEALQQAIRDARAKAADDFLRRIPLREQQTRRSNLAGVR